MMSEADSSDVEKYEDGDWLLKELSADGSAEPSTSNNDSNPSILPTGYLSAAHGIAEIKSLKTQYVENMKRLIRTCRQEVASLRKEKDTALQRLAAKDASRTKPANAEKGDKENSIVLSFKSSRDMHMWIHVQRLSVDGVLVGKGTEKEKREDPKTERSYDPRGEPRAMKMEMKEIGTQTDNQEEERRKEKSGAKGNGLSDRDMIVGLSSDEESRRERKRSTRSPSKEVKRRRGEEEERLRKIEEARRREGELKRRIESQKYQKGGRDGRRWEDERRERHRHL